MRRPRLRSTLRQLMVAVALLSLLFLLGGPLIRVGRPPCLSPMKTASWLLTHPGTANFALLPRSGSGEMGWNRCPTQDHRWKPARGPRLPLEPVNRLVSRATKPRECSTPGRVAPLTATDKPHQELAADSRARDDGGTCNGNDAYHIR